MNVEKKSSYGSPNKQRPFTPIQSPTPKQIILQQYNSFARSPKGNYENLFNELGLHELKRTGLDTDPQFISRSLSISCNCKKTQCLKLYCPCFANGQACNENCRCEECKNKQQNLNRHAAQAQSLIACNCKKSSCLKKYCICFLNGRKCGRQCQCVGCKNLEQQKEESQKDQRKFCNQKLLFSPPSIKKKVRIEPEFESKKITTRQSTRKEIKIKQNTYIQQQNTTLKKKQSAQTYDLDVDDKKLQSGKKTADQKQQSQLATKRQLLKK